MAELIVSVPGHPASYPLKIEHGLLDRLGEEIKAIYKQEKIAIVTDENVNDLYGQKVQSQLEAAGFEVLMIVVEPGEQSKSLEHLSQIYSALIDFGMTRSHLLIALGGGVVGDLAGYAAASYLRGIPFVQIPTTLLAQVDSSVGGKVAVDLKEGKNLVGAFYHPKLVIIDPNVLESLEDSAFADGMAEVIKYGLIKDQAFFKDLQSYQSRAEVMDHIVEVIEICCRIKRSVVESDEKDTGERMLLNFGHTIGHAIEAYYHYEDYTHGQAVAIGMVAINRLTEAMGISPANSTAVIEDILVQHGLPIALDQPEDYQEILPLIKNDKKNLNNTLFVVVLEDIGKAVRYEADDDFFAPILEGVSWWLTY